MAICSVRCAFVVALALCFASASAEENATDKDADYTCFKKKVPVAIGATLMGAIAFQMSLFYAMNHPDKDMRRHTYTVISSTVSIFCAVLLFSSFQELLEVYIEQYQLAVQVSIHFLHQLFWWFVMQVTLCLISGAVDVREMLAAMNCSWETQEAYRQFREKVHDRWMRCMRSVHMVGLDHDEKQQLMGLEEEKKREQIEMDQNQANMVCFGMLLAHMTGFASINAWSTLQQTEYFRATPFSTFSIIPLALCGNFLLQRFSDNLREKIAMADDGEWDKREEMWAKYTGEAENDVMALTASFLFAQTMRFTIGGVLPNVEGIEHTSTLGNHNFVEIGLLYTVGWLAVLVPVMFKHRKKDIDRWIDSRYGEFTRVRSPKFSPSSPKFSPSPAVTINGEFTSPSSAFDRQASTPDEAKKRETVVSTVECIADAFGMGFAWMIFYATRWMWASWAWIDQDRMLLAVMLALWMTFTGFFIIRIMDIIVDRLYQEDENSKNENSSADGEEEEGEEVSHTENPVTEIIMMFGFAIGFAWEQCFDVATEALSENLGYTVGSPPLFKLMLSITCAVIIVPAWRWWILPMQLKGGWEFGFVLDPHDHMWDKILDSKTFKEMKQNSTIRTIKRRHLSQQFSGIADAEQQPPDPFLRQHSDHTSMLKESLLSTFGKNSQSHPSLMTKMTSVRLDAARHEEARDGVSALLKKLGKKDEYLDKQKQQLEEQDEQLRSMRRELNNYKQNDTSLQEMVHQNNNLQGQLQDATKAFEQERKEKNSLILRNRMAASASGEALHPVQEYRRESTASVASFSSHRSTSGVDAQVVLAGYQSHITVMDQLVTDMEATVRRSTII